MEISTDQWRKIFNKCIFLNKLRYMFWIFIKIFIHHGHAYFTKKITYFLKLTRCTLPIREYPTQVVHKVHAFCLGVVNTPFGLQVHQFCTMYVSSPFICKRGFFFQKNTCSLLSDNVCFKHPSASHLWLYISSCILPIVAGKIWRWCRCTCKTWNPFGRMIVLN